MSKKRIIIVLGMHRSGTSAMARGLKALSVELGENLMPPVVGNNDKGFWEDMDVYRLNERLLAKSGSGWSRLAPLNSLEMSGERYAAERYEAAALLEKKMSGHQVHGFKDPRMSLLLPFWQCVFEDLGIDENYIIALRNPLEVAQSLFKRDKLDLIAGCSLWLKHTWAAVTHSEGKRRLGVSYSQIVSNPAEELARIASAFELPQPKHSDPALIEYLSEFITPELRHNRIPDNELNRSLSIQPAIPSLYRLMADWSCAPPDQQLEVPAKIKSQIESFWTVSRPVLALADTLSVNIARQTAETAKALQGIVDLTKSIETQKDLLANNEQSLAEEREVARNQQDVIAAREMQISDHKAELESVTANLAKAIEQQKNAELALAVEAKLRRSVEDALAEKEAQLTDAQSALTRESESRASAEKQLAEEARLRRSVEDALAEKEAQLTDAQSALTRESESRASLEAALADANKRAEAETERNSRLQTDILKAQVEAKALAEQEATLRKEHAYATTRIAELESDQQEMRASLQKAGEDHSRQIAAQRESKLLIQTLTDQDFVARKKLAEAHAKVERSEKHASELSSRLAGAQTSLSNQSKQLSEQASLLAKEKEATLALQTSLAAALAEAKEKTQTTRLIRQDLLKIQTSTSWKLTKPLRAAKRLLTPKGRLHTGQGKITSSNAQADDS